MKTVNIYGASDDLVELEGDLTEEFKYYDDEKPLYLAFSDGTVLSAMYGEDGIWTLLRVKEGSAKHEHIEATYPYDDYTDRVTLTGDLRWCVAGTGMVDK